MKPHKNLSQANSAAKPQSQHPHFQEKENRQSSAKKPTSLPSEISPILNDCFNKIRKIILESLVRKVGQNWKKVGDDIIMDMMKLHAEAVMKGCHNAVDEIFLDVNSVRTEISHILNLGSRQHSSSAKKKESNESKGDRSDQKPTSQDHHDSTFKIKRKSRERMLNNKHFNQLPQDPSLAFKPNSSNMPTSHDFQPHQSFRNTNRSTTPKKPEMSKYLSLREAEQTFVASLRNPTVPNVVTNSGHRSAQEQIANLHELLRLREIQRTGKMEGFEIVNDRPKSSRQHPPCPDELFSRNYRHFLFPSN